MFSVADFARLSDEPGTLPSAQSWIPTLLNDQIAESNRMQRTPGLRLGSMAYVKWRGVADPGR